MFYISVKMADMAALKSKNKRMKKRDYSLFLIPLVLLSVASCSNNKTIKTSTTLTKSIPPCSSSGAEEVLVCTKNQTSVLPFDSGVTMTLYGDDAENEEIKTNFVQKMSYYSALFDRHYDYQYRTSLDEKYQDLINVKTINDTISELNSMENNSSKDLVLPEELYQGLKIAVDFSLRSNLKYNLSIGSLSTLYDDNITNAQAFEYQNYLNQLSKDDSKLYQTLVMRDTQKVVVNRDFDKDEYQKASDAVLNKEELENIFTFKENNILEIRKIKTTDSKYTTSITLGGYGKGYAEKIFASMHPNVAFLLNGGSSSIMTQNVKTNGKPWKIRIDNPLYRQESSYVSSMYGFISTPLSKLNESEFYFESQNSFTLSTSGYYNNYFYTLGDNDEVILYHHIIDSNKKISDTYFDSASIMIDDPGYADMYSTALMNCSSLQEAEELRNLLDSTYNFSTWAFYTAHNKLNFEQTIKAYIPEAQKNKFHLMTNKEVDNLYPLITTFNYF